MSRRKRSGARPGLDDKPAHASGQEAGGSTQAPKSHFPSAAAIRETVESIVIAFVLAFLFRTFEAEAFVIPTGSMAPTLMGRHKDLECPQCGYPFQISASEEVDSRTNALLGPEFEVVSCICPMCGLPMNLGPEDESFKGDRILVNKSAYQFAEPSRWDVAVFKYPGGAATNFIKRMVGLPGETVRISRGNLWITRSGQPETIARKPPYKLRAMLRPVYDNDYVSPKLKESGWPARWQSFPPPDGSSAGTWLTSEDSRSFSTSGSTAGETWLRYQHFAPTYDQWRSILEGTLWDPKLRDPKPRLISDFCSYNTNRDRQSVERQGPQPDPESLGLYWVGDLAVECQLEVEKAAGEAVFELVEGGRRMQCRIDLTTGRATLSISGLAGFQPTALTNVRAAGSYEILFSNVDDELLLWVDGEVVSFDGATKYDPLDNIRPQPADLAPVGIAASGGAALKVSHLKVLRDIYYIAEMQPAYDRRGAFEFETNPYYPWSTQSVVDFLSDPRRWDVFLSMHDVQFSLGPDQFLMLGDNSPKSKDSRLWGKEFYVSRDLLIGKALYIYWPHSWNTVPGTKIPFPMFPNFKRMGFVR